MFFPEKSKSKTRNKKLLKIINLFLAILFCGCSIQSTPKVAGINDELLAETVKLSKEAKKFGRTLGIEPTEILSKSSDEAPAVSFLNMYVQEKMTISSPGSFYVAFSALCSNLPIKSLVNQLRGHSVYFRCTNEFASSEAVITLDFAKASLTRKAEVLFHEDLHMNTKQTWSSDYVESLVTPLAFLASLEFLKSKHEWTSVSDLMSYIVSLRLFSQELTDLVAKLTVLYSSSSPDDPNIHAEAENILMSFPNYRRYILTALKDQYFDGAFEAKISHDLMYYKDFNRIIKLYDKTGNLKTLIEDIKKAPSGTKEIEKYLEKLEEKYSKPP